MEMRRLPKSPPSAGLGKRGRLALLALRWLIPLLLFGGTGMAIAAAIGGNFTLSTTNGKVVTERSFPSKWQLIYFGYTSCTDVCSTVMQQVATALADLGPAAAQMQPLFITLAPEHDSPERLSQYLSNFDHRIIGLSGTEKQTNSATQSFRMYVKSRALGNDAYTIDHSSFLFLMKPGGRFAALLSGDSPGHNLADELRRQLH